MKTQLAIIGDFNPSNRSHIATNDAIEHCSRALNQPVEYSWIGTEEVALRGGDRLAGFGAFWIGPASPYRSIEGALMAIRTARERRIPFLGTCGGFQHIILEYVRNVLRIVDAQHEESDPGAANLAISRLSCSLVGRTMSIQLQPDSLIARAYGRDASVPFVRHGGGRGIVPGAAGRAPVRVAAKRAGT